MASSSDDIRKLFRDRKQQQQNSKRIDSPLARYDAAGRLFCTVCRLQIANESNWSSHLIDRSHRQVCD